MGFDAARGDMLTVEDLAFDENRAQPPVSHAGQVLATAENSPVLVKYAALLVGLLVVLAFGVRPALRRAAAAAEAGSQGSGARSCRPARRRRSRHSKPPEPVELDPERIRAQEIFEQVTGTSEARADAELAPVAELDSLRLRLESDRTGAART